MVVDLVSIILAMIVAFLLRFDFKFPVEFTNFLTAWLPIITVSKLGTLYIFNIYKGMYRYTSIWDITNIVKANLTASFLIMVIFAFSHGFAGFPRSVFVLDLLVCTALIASSRIAVRLIYSHQILIADPSDGGSVNSNHAKRLILIGAGRTGEKIAREILTTPAIPYKIVGFLDDNIQKRGATIHGIRVLGTVAELARINLPYDELIITAPSATGEEMRRIVEVCKLTGKRYKTVPDLPEIIDDDVSMKMVRDVSYVDLLRRDEIVLDTQAINNFIKGKRILVTGAGGSIGSELVRQCIQYHPGALILLDNSEYNLFSIQQELTEYEHRPHSAYVLGSIRDKQTLSNVFRDYKPHVILHAAAYKHVPLQEDHPWEAIQTNVLGTMNLIELVLKNKIEKFVLVSTDKAVHPINIMGATKRLAEIMVQSADNVSRTSFIAVRFGNVLGSSGSVIPLFERQIRNGGPVKITHPEMIRYFMSIPEAAQLILQASSFGGNGGRIYVLEMGKPVKIKDMAYDLIRLSGLEPEKDISVIYTGARPGEKLYEELIFDGEVFSKTDHKKIMTLRRNGKGKVEWTVLQMRIQELANLCKTYDHDALRQKLMDIIPEYKPEQVPPRPEQPDIGSPKFIA